MLKTYKSIYIIKICNLDKSAPIRRGGGCKLLCVSLAIPILKYVIKTAYTVNIIEKLWKNTYFWRIRRSGGGGSATKSKMTKNRGSPIGFATAENI